MTNSGPRIYNLFPLLAGPIEGTPGHDWISRLAPVAKMHFDWLFINPFHYPGFSGSLYAIKDPYALHPIVQGDSMKAPAELERHFIAVARERGLKVMIDLVINHTAKDALLAEAHAHWYRRNPDGSLYSPRAVDPVDPEKVTVWGDLAELDYSEPSARAGLVEYWSDYVHHQISLGVRGFRCDAAYQVEADIWSSIIARAQAECDDVVFAAETLGCTVEQVQALEQAGFDYIFNSAKWWDFQAPWLLEQYQMFRGIAPSIAFPESHDTERLAAELAGFDGERLERCYRQRYLFAALYSAGVMMPMGFEYGFAKPLHVIDTRPEDWEPARFDISRFIGAVNAMKAEHPLLNREAPQRRLEVAGDKIVALQRLPEGDNTECIVSLFNISSERAATLSVGDILSRLAGGFSHFQDITPEAIPQGLPVDGKLYLEPLRSRVFCVRP